MADNNFEVCMDTPFDIIDLLDVKNITSLLSFITCYSRSYFSTLEIDHAANVNTDQINHQKYIMLHISPRTQEVHQLYVSRCPDFCSTLRNMSAHQTKTSTVYTAP